MRRVCLYMGFVNDIRRKNVAVEGWLLFLGKRLSSYFLQYEPFVHLYIDITAPGLSSYVLRHEPRNLSVWLSVSVSWVTSWRVASGSELSTLLTADGLAKWLVTRCLLRFCNVKRCFQKGVLAGAEMLFFLCNMLMWNELCPSADCWYPAKRVEK